MRFEVTGMDEALAELEKLDAYRLAPKMLTEAAPIAVSALKASIKRFAHRGYATGALAASIKATEAKLNAYGCFIAARPTGADRKGVRNGEKLAYLQYGTQKQTASDVLGTAVKAAERKCIEAMEEVLAQEVGVE